MTLKQRQRQSQALVMTPQLQQAIRLLQMATPDLRAFIAEELERNPLLEVADGDEPEERRAANREEAPAQPADAPRQDAPNTPSDSDGIIDEAAETHETLAEAFADAAPSEERLVEMDINPAEVFDDASASDQPLASATAGTAAAADDAAGLHTAGAWGGAPASAGGGMMSSTSGRGPADADMPGLEATLRSTMSLRQHLIEQMELSIHDAAGRLMARQLIEHVDSDGYLREPLSAIATRLGAAEEQLEEVLHILQGLEPAGVFARDLAECFRLQLEDMGELDAPMQALLDNLELLAQRDFTTLARRCNVPAEQLPHLISRLKRLDPRPGAAFAPEPVQVVVPDVFVSPAPDGGWQVELNNETLPRLLVNNDYRLLVRQRSAPEHERHFIEECASRASWLVRSLQQRARTILAVAGEIVRRQDGFLTHGVAALKPLTLRQVADSLNMHESTISRVVANKYMATPRGILEFRFFFSAAISSTDGEEQLSAEAVRHRIRALIDAETPDKVLSDDAIVKILRAEGIDIARRTVAKYREAMGIPSSPKRRREKRLALQAGGGSR